MVTHLLSEASLSGGKVDLAQDSWDVRFWQENGTAGYMKQTQTVPAICKHNPPVHHISNINTSLFSSFFKSL